MFSSYRQSMKRESVNTVGDGPMATISTDMNP
jgi:hypothetical protein